MFTRGTSITPFNPPPPPVYATGCDTSSSAIFQMFRGWKMKRDGMTGSFSQGSTSSSSYHLLPRLVPPLIGCGAGPSWRWLAKTSSVGRWLVQTSWVWRPTSSSCNLMHLTHTHMLQTSSQPKCYCISIKSWFSLYSNLLYKNGSSLLGHTVYITKNKIANAEKSIFLEYNILIHDILY